MNKNVPKIALLQCSINISVMIHRTSDANVFENFMIDRQSKPKVPIDVMTSDLLLQGY